MGLGRFWGSAGPGLCLLADPRTLLGRPQAGQPVKACHVYLHLVSVLGACSQCHRVLTQCPARPRVCAPHTLLLPELGLSVTCALQLPELGGLGWEHRHGYMRMVASYLHILDSSLSTGHLMGMIDCRTRASFLCSTHSKGLHTLSAARAAACQLAGVLRYMPRASECQSHRPRPNHGGRRATASPS